MLRLGIVGIVLAFVGAAGLFGIGLRPVGTADSLRHLDYAWNVWHGSLPKWRETTAPIMQGDRKWVGRPQFVSHHPPLYYALIAPSAAFVDLGEWQIGVFVARGLTLVIGIAAILSIAWTAWVATSSSLLTLGATSFAASWTAFVQVSGDIMNDALVVLATATTMGLCVLALKKGPTPAVVISLCAACAAGMGARATFVGALAVAFASLVAGGFLRQRWSGTLRAVIGCMAIAIFVLATTGWFYYGNYLESGHWYRNSDQSWAEQLGRERRGLYVAVTHPLLYRILPEGLYGREWKSWGSINVTISAAVFLVSAVGLVLAGATARWHRQKAGIVAGLVLLLLSAYVFQLVHAIGYGTFKVRYLLPAAVAISLGVAVGLTSVRRLAPYTLSIMVLIGWTMAVLNTIWLVATRFGKADVNDLIDYFAAVESNNIQVAVPVALIVMVAVGAALQVVSLFRVATMSR